MASKAFLSLPALYSVKLSTSWKFNPALEEGWFLIRRPSGPPSCVFRLTSKNYDPSRDGGQTPQGFVSRMQKLPLLALACLSRGQMELEKD